MYISLIKLRVIDPFIKEDSSWRSLKISFLIQLICFIVHKTKIKKCLLVPFLEHTYCLHVLLLMVSLYRMSIYVTAPVLTLNIDNLIYFSKQPLAYISESHLILEKSDLHKVIQPEHSWNSNQSLFCFAFHYSDILRNQTQLTPHQYGLVETRDHFIRKF